MTISKSFGGEAPRRPHLVSNGKGGVPGEIGDLRSDIENGFSVLEGRSGTFSELEWVDGGHPAAAGGDIVLKGSNMVQGQDFAALTLGTGTAELVFTALKPGTAGNDFTVAIADGGTAGSEAVAKTGNAFVITVEAGVSTADQIATAVNANAADSDGYLTCNGGGAGTPVVTAATALTGGTGEGWTCWVSGVECLPANTTGANGGAALTETACTVTVPDLTAETDARAVGDLVAITFSSDGVRSQSLTGVLA
jgi:hypothetical protein